MSGNIPPKLPPRNPDQYDALRRSSNPASKPPANTTYITSSSPKGSASFKPYLPKGLFKKSPSHESSLKQHEAPPPLPPHPNRMSSPTNVPPLPSKPKQPVGSTTPTSGKRPPAPLPVRAASFADPRSLHPVISSTRRPPPKGRGGDDDSSGGEEYEDVSFINQEDYHPSDGDGYSFLKFIEHKQSQFPMAFEVVLGYSSLSEDVSISEGERFIAHFLKHAKMFTIETESGDQYTIPYNTSFQFAILHNPNNNTKEALSGFIFKTAGDMMLAKNLPRIIRAKKSFRGAGPESCVTTNELLFVKEVVAKEGERRYVKCVQVASGDEKRLHDDCHGDFTTAPHEVRVYLPEILKHFQLPLETLMCMGPDNEEDIPSHLVSTVATISNTYVEESLIASSIMDDRNNDDGSDFTVPDDLESIVLNDIPLNFDINVNPLPVSPAIAEKILKVTDKLYTEFDPVNVFPYLAKYSRSQLSLIKSVQKENNRIGITLIETKAIREVRETDAAAASLSNSSGQMSSNNIVFEKRLQELESQNLMYQKALENISGRSINVVTSVGGSLSMAKLHTDFIQMRHEIEELKKTVSQLSSALSSSDKKVNSGESASQQLPLSTSSREENKRFLLNLDVNELCEVLIAMNLDDLVPKFRSEMINGALFSELSEEILQTELGVERAIQRMKLLKLLSGEYSAEQYLIDGEDHSYIKMTKS